MTRTITSILLSTAAAVSLSACAMNDGMDTASSSDSAAMADASSGDMMANPVVGGAEMYPSYTIVQNASNANNLKTLVAAVSAAGLVDTLNSPGPFTVFAPLDSAFSRLAPGTLDTLLLPENKEMLTKILTYHVVPGNMSAQMLMDKIKMGNGKATLKTVNGATVGLSNVNGNVAITDPNGTTFYVQQADVKQKNGVVHTINGVLIPKM